MKIFGDIDLNQGQLKKALFEHVTEFPADAEAGRVVFLNKRVYVCTDTSGTPTWIPLTNEIDIQVHVQTVASAQWEIPYSQANTNFTAQVYDGSGLMILPDEVDSSTPGLAKISFGQAIIGKAILIHELSGTLSDSTGGGTVVLGTDGKLLPSLLPSISISETFVVNTQAAMLALSAQTGDVAVRTDISKSFILAGTNPGQLSSWQELLTPTDVTTALRLKTARTISLSGELSGSASFDGSADISISATIRGEVVNSLGSVSGAVSVNYTNGTYVTATITGSTSLSITGIPDTTRAYGLTFELTNGGTGTFTYPSNTTWLTSSGAAPALKASGTNVVSFITRNGGSSWIASVI